ncbi:MAG: diguanylate cyclase [Gammaproteobacteria bacterium]|nr:diguanylate cyclase [Gammaproteobacteria bacterium]
MAAKKPDISEQLAKLQAKYEASLPDRLNNIDQLWQALITNEWNNENLQHLHREVHSITGSGANFGYTELSNEARAIEKILSVWEKTASVPQEEQRSAVHKQLSNLSTFTSKKYRKKFLPAVTSDKPTDSDHSLIYLLEEDKALACALQSQFSHFGYQVELFTTEHEIIKRLKQQMPDALVIDISLEDVHLTGSNLFQSLHKALAPNTPFVIYSSCSNFEARLAAVRAGASAYFVKPVDTDALVETLNKLTYRTPDQPYRIVIVDDDEVLTKHFSLVLTQAGMKVSIQENPEEALDTLIDINPDLLLMDIYMPNCTGIELAQIIRQQEEFIALPIVFLSTETSILKHFTALRTGGDDFLCKPIDDTHLIESVTFRAARARELKTQMTQDSLTRLLKHAKIKENLVIETSRAMRNNTTLSFVMIDIDHFKQVNDLYGHLTGDRVLKGLANIFRKRLRVADSIGRYGGEEFAIILPQCDTASAKKIVDKIRDDFSGIEFTNNNTKFKVSFSAGIACYPALKTPEKINQAADLALYQAKENGRNRTIISEKT